MYLVHVFIKSNQDQITVAIYNRWNIIYNKIKNTKNLLCVLLYIYCIAIPSNLCSFKVFVAIQIIF